MNVLVTLIVLVYLASIYFFVRRKPLVALKSENRTIAEAILQSAPSEGTDEEFVNNGALEGIENDASEQVEEEHTEYSSLIAKSGDHGNVKFVKDSFTGQLRRVESSTFAAAPRSPKLTSTKTIPEAVTSSNLNSVYHGRGLGPKLCGGCLCDRRTHTRPITNTTLPFWIERFFMPTADGSRAPVRLLSPLFYCFLCCCSFVALLSNLIFSFA